MFKFLVITVALQIACSSAFKIQPKIINGFATDPEEAPFYVFFYTERNETSTSCGGSLISDGWVVTAAHCLDGESDLGLVTGGVGEGQYTVGYKIPLANQFVHPDYDTTTHVNDIALIKLPYNIERQNHLRPAKLPTDCGEDLEYTKVVAAGTGQKSVFFQTPLDLKLEHAYLQTTDDKDCFESSIQSNAVFGSQICAYSEDGQSVYQGDSGGPLLKQGDLTLIGITSYVQIKTWPIFRKHPINLQIFTKIHYYFDWISEMTGIELPECEHPLNVPPPPPSTPTPPSSKKSQFWSWFSDLFNKH